MPVSLTSLRDLSLPDFRQVRETIARETLARVPLPAIDWRAGEEAMLYRKNPYKGSLRTGRRYAVVKLWGDRIFLRADNGTVGCFDQRYFVRPGDEHMGANAKGGGTMSSVEYEEIMLAQDLLSDSGSLS